MRNCFLCLYLVFSLLLARLATAAQADAMLSGRQCAEDFQQGRLDALWGRMTPDMQQALGSRAALQDFWQQTQDALGAETELQKEGVTTEQQLHVYTRESLYANNSTPAQLRCTFNAENRIAGFKLEPSQGANEAAPAET